MNQILRLITSIAVIIVMAWLVIAVFRFAAWLINGLIGVAALVLIAALVYRSFKKSTNQPPNKQSNQKPPLKIEREPSRERDNDN